MAFDAFLGAGRRARRSLAAVGVVAAIAAAASPALANDDMADVERRTAARDLAVQGAEAFEQGDYELALDRFTRANSVFAAPTLALLRARALERLGRYVEALDAYESTQRTPLAPDASEAFRQAVSDARNEGAELRARVPRLTVRVVASESLPPGLSVTLDGRPLPPALLDVERPLDPGHHELEARADGYEVAEKTLSLAVGERREIELRLVKIAPALESLRERAAATSAESFSHSTPVVGWALAGVGGALLATSAVTGAMALGTKSDLDGACQPGCPESMRDDIDAFRVQRTTSYVTFALGAASLGVGGYLLLARADDEGSTALGIGPGAVSLRRRF